MKCPGLESLSWHPGHLHGRLFAIVPGYKVHWLQLVIKLIIVIQVYGPIAGRVEEENTCCSPRSPCAACMEKRPAVITTFPQLKTLHVSVIQSPFQPQPKNKHIPFIILHPNYIPPTTPFHWLQHRGLFILCHSKENSPTGCCGRAAQTWYKPDRCSNYTPCLPPTL